MDYMLDPPDDYDDCYSDQSGDDVEPIYDDGYDDEEAANASSRWQNSRNL